jgi:hypothetical protein
MQRMTIEGTRKKSARHTRERPRMSEERRAASRMPLELAKKEPNNRLEKPLESASTPMIGQRVESVRASHRTIIQVS